MVGRDIFWTRLQRFGIACASFWQDAPCALHRNWGIGTLRGRWGIRAASETGGIQRVRAVMAGRIFCRNERYAWSNRSNLLISRLMIVLALVLTLLAPASSSWADGGAGGAGSTIRAAGAGGAGGTGFVGNPGMDGGAAIYGGGGGGGGAGGGAGGAGGIGGLGFFSTALPGAQAERTASLR
jgi:hypothetical protein